MINITKTIPPVGGLKNLPADAMALQAGRSG